MKTRPGLIAICVLLGCAGPGPASEKPLRVLLLVGGKYHEYDRIGAIMKDFIEKSGRCRVDVTHDADQLRAERISGYDVVCLNTLRWSGSDMKDYQRAAPEALAGLAGYVRDGGGLVAAHSAGACFDEWPEYRNLLGGIWVWKQSHHDDYRDMAVRIAGAEHPVTRGLRDFGIKDELYYNMSVGNGARVLARATSVKSGEDAPMAWVTTYGKGRVFYTALGHGVESWENGNLQALVLNALAWVQGR